MLSAQDILTALDQSNDGYYCHFASLGDAYSYLIDARLNLFRGGSDWAVAIERLGYNPRGGRFDLNIHYYGNCLLNLEHYNNRPTNYYDAAPVDWDSFTAAFPDELLAPTATSLLVRGQAVPLSQRKADYVAAGIELVECEPDRISPEEVGRLLIIQYQDLFRATDAELYKSVPAHLTKILVLDEWYHRDFNLSAPAALSDEAIRQTYDFNKQLTGLGGMSLEAFAASIQQQQQLQNDQNRAEWEHNRPGSYETWPMLAAALATNDPSCYQPTLAPNTHWRNWPESGSL